ncbi:NAD(P)-dependent alcohol dehydrogenase [Gordonia sp. (in: high G+C Gram-positive bacteria)]|jgi:propanol-preferring alcohol dehydrogenase|uniref:NAD(P)-dependent alcohol dehydrogenase n=1 Tax=Gordonia sp. (in: high G+C Gram-positive bacteria) TaxID=84139 RepID=UPI001DD0B079|nr:NAD(P)-dependent alcohol dehydrogenase [Gordonia sp. (in: high G+C Gram-positive bacteria)]MCB1295580.1 NAD(P)-dependent alcohol dehydrogenase [Gordonia sp. (in: high G+C Gram-positive bacteria)]HQV20182.1 NAD(P)-dependent alcohol dehydrogenase [Gordonia sp. (in: high G+C Gram-positive bacteria)]
MKAIQFIAPGQPPELREVDKPSPGPGQVLLKITAAGACHSDDFVLNAPAGAFSYPLPMTLGHEGVGIVAEVGSGVRLSEGTAVAVYGPWGCGACYRCAQGQENYCLNAAEMSITPPGLGTDGAMADYLLIDNARHLVPLGDLDPVTSVALTDAGLTPYHAIKPSLAKLVGGTTAVVIGAGGLGHVGIQLLRALTPSRIIAVDVTEEKLAFAREVGAHETVLSNADTVAEVRKITGKQGATAVFDFVGYQPTIDIAMGVVGVLGDVVIVGLGDGVAAAKVGFFSQPYEVSVRSPYWGTRGELIEVLDLARDGVLDVEVERFSLDDGLEAYRRLAANDLRGRAVVVPD